MKNGQTTKWTLAGGLILGLCGISGCFSKPAGQLRDLDPQEAQGQLRNGFAVLVEVVGPGESPRFKDSLTAEPGQIAGVAHRAAGDGSSAKLIALCCGDRPGVREEATTAASEHGLKIGVLPGAEALVQAGFPVR